MPKITTSNNEFIDSQLDFNSQVETSTGVVLVLSTSLTSYAGRKKLEDVKVFLAFFPDNEKEWLIVKGQEPAYSSKRYEDIACHLDMMAASK
jgi:hypothetical protein